MLITSNELNEMQKRAFEIKEEIQDSINKKDYRRLIVLTKEYEKMVKRLKKYQREIDKYDKV